MVEIVSRNCAHVIGTMSRGGANFEDLFDNDAELVVGSVKKGTKMFVGPSCMSFLSVICNDSFVSLIYWLWRWLCL